MIGGSSNTGTTAVNTIGTIVAKTAKVNAVLSKTEEPKFDEHAEERIVTESLKEALQTITALQEQSLQKWTDYI